MKSQQYDNWTVGSRFSESKLCLQTLSSINNQPDFCKFLLFIEANKAVNLQLRDEATYKCYLAMQNHYQTKL